MTGDHRLIAVLLMLLACALVAPAGLADPALGDPGRPVGGSLLSTDGVIVHRAPDTPKPPEVTASAYVVADLDTGAVLAAKDPHGRYRPASTIKVLTALTLIPRLNPDEKVKATRADAAVDGSKVGVVPGKPYRMEDLFNALLLASGNDAARMLARAGGGLERTVARMNKEADELHAYDTLAKTPHGLDRPGQRSSAYDLALIGQAGLAMPDLREYVGTLRAQFPSTPGRKSFQIANHNDLLTEYEGAVGVKTGYTSEAGATYIGAATRDGHTIIITLMHSEPDFWTDAHALMDWGFAATGKVEPVGKLVEPGPLETAASARETGQDAPTRAKAPQGLTPINDSSGGGLLLPVLLVTMLGGVTLTGFAALFFRSVRSPNSRKSPGGSGSAWPLRHEQPDSRYQGRRRHDR